MISYSVSEWFWLLYSIEIKFVDFKVKVGVRLNKLILVSNLFLYYLPQIELSLKTHFKVQYDQLNTEQSQG